MNPLIKLDTDALLDDFNNFKDGKTKNFSLAKHYPINNFVPHILSLFANVPLIRNSEGLISMNLTIDATKIEDTIKLPDSNIIKTLNIRQLILLVSTINRSKIIPVKQKESTYKAFTPLFMYAHKLYNNVQYTEWDTNDEKIQFALGRTLYNMLVFAKANTKPNFSVAEVIRLRKSFMTYKTGKKEGITESNTSYKMNPIDTDYPADILRMELQTWIANTELRDENAMILDMWDWGNIPTAFDSALEEKPIKARPKDI